MNPIKPNRILKSSTVAVLSPSWGGPSLFPKLFDMGISSLKSLGLTVKEYPTSRMSSSILENNPKLRAEDLNNAFADDEVDAIVVSIGGEDSIKILPYLDTKVILRNPKILMGYSDTSTLLTYLNTLGMVTFHGPSIMSGFAQMNSMLPEFRIHIEHFFLKGYKSLKYKPYTKYSNGYPNWNNPLNLGKINKEMKNEGWHFLQERVPVSGRLFGGNIETLKKMSNSSFWPKANFWNDKIIFFETSEDKPRREKVEEMLTFYGTTGILAKIKAILFGRARDYTDREKLDLDNLLINVVSNKFGRNDIPIVSNMDFGHTDPQFILPLGIRAKVNPTKKLFEIVEYPFT